MAKKILIADDEEQVRLTITRALAAEPFQFCCASNGIETLQLAESEKPDLILLDINMPFKDGREVIQELRQKPETKGIPVIMITGRGQLMDKVVGYELGARDYITKPFDIEDLRARIRHFFSTNK